MLDVIASSGIYAYLIIALLCILIVRYALPRIARIPFKMIRFILIVGAIDRKSTRLNSSHNNQSRMPSSA